MRCVAIGSDPTRPLTISLSLSPALARSVPPSRHLSLSTPPPLCLSRICGPRKDAEALRLSSSPSQASGAQAVKLLHRRGLAGGGDHHGPPKVNFWLDPLSPSKWKEDHFVIVSLSGWALLIYGGFKMFSGGKKEKKE